MESIDHEEFDRRLQQSTERMRRQRFALEEQALKLEDLVGRYSAVLERIEAEEQQEADISVRRRKELRTALAELAERTSAIAATL